VMRFSAMSHWPYLSSDSAAASSSKLVTRERGTRAGQSRAPHLAVAFWTSQFGSTAATARLGRR
jgi:hypothetical protein